MRSGLSIKKRCPKRMRANDTNALPLLFAPPAWVLQADTAPVPHRHSLQSAVTAGQTALSSLVLQEQAESTSPPSTRTESVSSLSFYHGS